MWVVLGEDGNVTINGSPGHSPAAPANSADEIEKLADLKAKGLLTDAEFAAGKKKILGI